MKITLYTALLDLHKIANEDYEGVRWSLHNNYQIVEGQANVEIHVNYETYIRLLDTASDNKQLIQG